MRGVGAYTPNLTIWLINLLEDRTDECTFMKSTSLGLPSYAFSDVVFVVALFSMYLNLCCVIHFRLCLYPDTVSMWQH